MSKVYQIRIIVFDRVLTLEVTGPVLISYEAALVLLGQLSRSEHAREVYKALGINRLSAWPEVEATIKESSVIAV